MLWFRIDADGDIALEVSADPEYIVYIVLFFTVAASRLGIDVTFVHIQ